MKYYAAMSIVIVAYFIAPTILLIGSVKLLAFIIKL